MSRETRARLSRLLQARGTQADRVAVEVGALTRAAAGADEATENARQVWRSRVEHPGTAESSPGELMEAHAYALALQKTFEDCARRARVAHQHLSAGREKLRAARVAVRQVELWQERVAAEDTAQENQRERRANDELASRTHGRT